jgi:hypothetical protein
VEEEGTEGRLADEFSKPARRGVGVEKEQSLGVL